MIHVITEPACFLESSSSCIDLIFTNQPNIIMDSGIQSPPYGKYNHQIKYSKFDLKIEYPPSSSRKNWDYNVSETDSINPFIESFDWSYLFSDKNGHEQKDLLTKHYLILFTILFLTKLCYTMIKLFLG